jgi:hypothetical protein
VGYYVLPQHFFFPIFNVQKHLFRGLGDVECWLELAIDSMNIDNNIDKLDGTKKVSSYIYI